MSKQIFQYYSDLHLEHQKQLINIELIQHIYPENLILAGDIGNPYMKNYWDFLHNESKIFTRVFLICGNHEYYGSSILQTNAYIKRQLKLSGLKNVYFLDNDVFQIDNIKIIGSTLWSYIPKEYEKE